MKLIQQSLPIQKRLSLSYMVLIILIVMMICFTLLGIFFSNMLERSRKEMDQQLEMLSTILVTELNAVVHTGNTLASDSFIKKQLEALEYRDLSDYIELYTRNRGVSPIVAKMIMVNSSLQLLDPINNRAIYLNAILMNTYFTEFLSSDTPLLLSSPGIFPFESADTAEEALTVTCCQRLFDDHDILRGYMMTILDKEYLFSIIWEQTVDKAFTGVSVYDHHNTRIFSVGTEINPKEIETDFSLGQKSRSFWAKIGNELNLVFIQPITGFNWTIVALVPFTYIFNELILAFILILIIGLVAILLSYFVSTILSKRITHPLLEVTRAMHRYDDSQSLESIEVEATGELKYLVTVYNKMVQSINDSIRTIYEEQEKKSVAELKSMQYELDFLQAQINPHFIHNTLNAVGYLAQKHDDQELYQALKAFNTLLRASISGTREMIPLGKEIELVESFIKIQQLRYGDSFSVTYEIDPAIEKLEVPKLILQPVVENAIFYGEEKKGQTLISIKAEIKDENFLLIVSDNGPGMDTEYMERSNTENTRTFNRVGLKNIDERIKILFGTNFGITIESSNTSGTSITILFPRS